MPQHLRWTAILLAVLTVSAAHRQENKDDPTPPKTTDTIIYEGLRDVINHGADVYNSSDHAGCYRIYEGSLLSIKPLLAHRPDLQQTITKAIERADADPRVWRRAFTLRAALDNIRAELNPKKPKKPVQDKDKKKTDPSAEQLPPPIEEGQDDK